jgi:hypothetical protein
MAKVSGTSTTWAIRVGELVFGIHYASPASLGDFAGRGMAPDMTPNMSPSVGRIVCWPPRAIAISRA